MADGRERAWAFGSVAVGVALVTTMLAHGWVPLDEGTIVFAARQWTLGRLPHADFAYPYTGALAAWHAAGFATFGDSMTSPRLQLGAAFVAWLVAVWSLARGLLESSDAAVVTLLAATWSLLVYPAASPNWYLLFLATWMLLAMARWRRTGGAAPLIVAGMLAGTGIIIKQAGVLIGVAAGFAVLAAWQEREGVARRRDPVTIALLVTALLVPFGVAARRGVTSGESLLIALPLAAVIGGLLSREWQGGAGTAARRRTLYRDWGWVLLGALAPVLAWLVPYARRGALGALARGTITGALDTASVIDAPMTNVLTLVAYAAPFLLLAAAMSAAARSRAGRAASLAGALAVVVAAAKWTAVYLSVWYGAQAIVALAIAAGALALARPRAGDRAAASAWLATAALLLLLQIPYAAPNYFAYVAPLGLGIAVVLARRFTPHRTLAFAGTCLIAFGAWFHRIGSVGTVGLGPVWWDDAHRLPGAHAGLLVTRPDSTTYEELLAAIRNAGGADAFVAGPELIELYAMSGTSRAVPQPYALGSLVRADTSDLAATIDTARVRAVIINHAPIFLRPVGDDARAWIAARYPVSRQVGAIEVRTR